MKYLVANFKQNFTFADLKTYLTLFIKNHQPHPEKQVILAGSFIHLPVLSQNKIGFSVSAQTVSRYPSGPHTGQIGAPELQGLADYCLVGHSEVRRELGDTDQSVTQKVKLLQQNSLTPIICVDSPYLESQIQNLKTELLTLENLFFAYEPLSAIGTGQPDTPAKANEMAFKIKNLTSKSFPVLYGGSVTPDNVREFTQQEYVDGVLVGTASLDPQIFIDLINHV